MIYLGIVFVGLLAVFALLRRKFTSTEALLLIVGATLFTEWNVQVGGQARVTIYDLLLLLSVIVWTGLLVRNGMKVTANEIITLSLLIVFALLIWCCVVWMIHPNNPSIVYAGWKSTRLGLFLIYPILGVQLARMRSGFQWTFFKVLLLGGAINGSIGVIQSLTNGEYLSGIYTNHRFLGLFTPLPNRWLTSMTGGVVFSSEQFAGFTYRAHGTFLDVTWYSPFMLVMVCLWLGFLLRVKTSFGFRVCLGGVAICVTALVLSATRGGFLALLVVLLLLMLFRFQDLLRTSLRFWPILLVLLVIFVLGSFYFSTSDVVTQRLFSVNQAINRLSTTFSNENVQVATFNGRFELWSVALARWAESPILGTGEEIFVSDIGWRGTLDNYNVPLHNQLLFFLYYNGIVAILLFCIVYCIFFVSSCYLAQCRELDGAVGLGWALGLVGLSINGVTSDWLGFASTSTGALFFLLGMFVVARLSFITTIRIVK